MAEIVTPSAPPAPGPQARAHSRSPLLPELIGEQARRTPEAVAVSCGGRQIPYGELDALANGLAHRLRAAGVGPEARVALFAERSAELVLGALAVLKAGGAYVPLDPLYPRERLAFLLEDSRAVAVLAPAHLEAGLPGGTPVLRLDLAEIPRAAEPPAGGAGPQNLAYVIYTSGSTGRPKGVQIQHASLNGFVRWYVAKFGLGPGERTSQIASPAFDASITELWPALASGATLCIPDEATRTSAPAVVRWMAEQGITHGYLPTPLAELAMGAPWPAESALRSLLTGGDRLHRWPAATMPAPVYNVYGPAEATVFVTCATLEPGTGREDLPPIGPPLANARIHLLDAGFRPLPPGEVGEIWIGGEGLARGYLGRPDLTAERFLPDPFAGVAGTAGGGPAGSRLYRTGDLARLLPDGSLDFVGRIDHQVKIRGFRVELGEIEAALAAHSAVREAAVLVKEDGAAGKRLVAFTAPAGPAPGMREMRAFLAERLPDYMLPSAFVWLEALPLSPNHKVDRRALERLEVTAELSAEHAAPRTAVEEALAGIWAELLGQERIGIRDDFLELGGHSLLAVQALARVRQLFGVEPGIRTLFESPTVEALARAIEELRLAGGAAGPALAPVPRDGELPLSFAQARLWFLDRLQPGSSVYNVPVAWRLRGPLKPEALAAALNETLRRHEALRTRFLERAEGPIQAIDPAGAFPLPEIDLGGLPEPTRQQEEVRLAAAEAVRPFDLARGRLARALLLRSREAERLLVLNLHHAVSDGWSVGVLARELEALYGAALAGTASPLPELPVQYLDYAVWQRRWLQGEALEGRLAYWRERLAGHPPVLELPTDRPRPAVQTFRGGVERLSLGAGLSERLRALSRQQGASLFTTLLAGFLALLHRYTGQPDLLVGTALAGRGRVELERLIGFFVNTLALRTDAGGDPTFAELLGRARETALGAYAHGDLPFERLVEELAPERSLSHSPLLQAAFVLHTEPMQPPRLAGVEAAEVALSIEAARFDLAVALTAGSEGPEGLAGSVEYNRDLFDAATARRLAAHLRTLLEGAAIHPAGRLSDLPLLSPAERDELLAAWSGTAREYPASPLVHELFAAQARRRPEALAVAMGGRWLTYGELEARSNRLAHCLRSLGVGPETLVGICAERTPERVVAVLAVLKAGGAYVSLDPAYPPQRLAFLLADAGVTALLAETRFLDRMPDSAAPMVPLDQDLPGDGDRPPAAELGPDHLAYVIYTSGSTGRPKGVAVPHRGLLNLVRWHVEAYGVTAEDRGTLVASPAFDASVWELWPLLAAGAAAIIPDEEIRLSPRRLLDWWAEQGITLAFLPTPLAEPLLEEEMPGGLALRMLAVGGDRLHRGPRPRTPFRLVNHYGPSEYSVVTTAGTALPGATGAPPIGRAIANTRVYVLDAHQQPVPQGVPGELYVAGAGLARGYLLRSDLTAERFLPDPFAIPGNGPGERMYRTGDRVRRLPDGNLDFLGRIDHQVKIRGMRVELGEIEAALDRHPQVREAAVLVKDGRLAAYVATAGGLAALRINELHAFLEQRLPAYMVPQAWALLDELPLTPNGKVDRRALARVPAEPLEASRGEHLAPRTGVERALARIWAELLKLDRVGVRDNFFHLGGHSLLATQVVSRVRRVFGVELEIRSLFEEPTVEALARRIEGGQERAGEPPAEPGTAAPPLRPLPRGEGTRLPLSFAQARLWFLDQLEPGSLYNIPAMFRLEGPVDVAALAAALAAIVRRHEVLRTRFEKVDDEPVQVISPADESLAPLSLIDLSALPALPAKMRSRESARLAREEALRPFDLSQSPLARFTLVKMAEEEHVLFLSLHHIVADGWSMGVLLRELEALYGGRAPLPNLPVQYADYAVWQRGWLQGETLEREIGYWRGRLAGAPAAIDLPADRPRPAVQSFRGSTVARRLPDPLAARIEAVSRELEATPFVVLMAAFQALLGRLTGQPDVSVGTPLANRTRVELEGLIGFFVNTLVLRADLAGDPTFAALVERVREAAVEAHGHQDLPFEKLVEALEPERSLSHSPLFQVMFVLQRDWLACDLPGLRLTPFAVDRGTAKFDLLLIVDDRREGMEITCEYSADLFDRTTAARLLASFEVLLQAALDDPRRRLRDLPLLAAAAHAQLLVEWNDNAATAPQLTQAQRFAEQARRTPDAVAVTFRGEDLTYAEAAARAGRLARRLRRLGVGPGVVVGVCLERSLAVPVAVLAVLQADGVLLPLDPAYPADRLAFMLADTKAPVLISQQKLLDLWPDYEGTLLCLEALDPEPAPDFPPAPVEMADLAYLIYTSGSTGRPKGIAMTHGALANLVAFHLACRTGAEARTLQFSPLSFDVCFQEMFSTWAAGGTVVLISDDDRRDPEALLEILERERITRLFLPFVALNHLAETAERLGAAPSCLREVITAGEQLQSSAAVTGWFRRLNEENGCTLENQYGPSELHVVTSHPLPRDPGDWAPLPPVGRSILNLRLHLLDPHGQPVPIGVPGEIFLGGPQMARGYLHRPDLTADRFVPDPFGEEPGERLYRTGDLARWLPDSNVEFLGRIDFQVKIRGFRIELGEIEAVLASHPAVRQAAVLARQDRAGGRRLVACLAPPVPEAELREHLRARLPDYMVPAAFVGLPELPVAATGKVDRQALAKIEVALAPAEGYVAPRTLLEEALAGIWAELLGRPQVGVRDDFFDLGGHSLLATQVLSRVRRLLGAELSIRALFEAPTVEALAHQIERVRQEADRAAGLALAPVPRDPAGPPLPLSFAQARLWFLDHLQPGSAVYNLPVAYRLRGRLEPAALAAALGEIARRHEALRTRFSEGEEGQRQVVDPVPPAFVLPRIDLGGLPEPARRREAERQVDEEARRPFDLARGPLLRSLLVRLEDGEWTLVLAMHHIVSDGWSVEVLLRELETLCAAALAGLPSPLPELPVQYADFAIWQRQWLQGEVLERQLAYWRQRLAGAPTALELPVDRPHPAVQSFRGGAAERRLGTELAPALRDLARRERATLFMAGLAAYQILLHRATGQGDLLLGTPVAGRNRLELEGLIGFFVNTLVLRADLADDPTVRELLGRVRAEVLGAQAHQDLPFEKLVEELAPARSLSRSPLVQTVFSLQASSWGGFGLPGVAADRVAFALGIAKFELEVSLAERGDELAGLLEYNTDLFDPATAARLLGHFEQLLAGMAAAPDRRVSELELLSGPERQQLLVEWSDTAAGPEGSAPQGFAAAAARHPEATALEYGTERLTYRELDQRSNQLARRLLALGLGRETVVGVGLERSAELAVALLAVLKAGAAFLPLDPAHPQDRLAYILEDSGAAALIAREWPSDSLPVLPPDAPGESAAPLETEIRPGDLAYVIYTSGSTGRPKGVLVEHGSLANVLFASRLAFGFDATDVMPVLASSAFDIFLFELLNPLMAGGTAVLISMAGGPDLDLLAGLLERSTRLHAVPALVQQIVEQVRATGSAERCRGVRTLFTGGDAVPAALLAELRETFPTAEIRVLYGPTEGTIIASSHRVPAAGPVRSLLGRPLANMALRLHDRQGLPVPAGVPGEIWIGGAGVSRGYLNRPELTAERYLEKEGERWYRTGDLARWLPDGTLEFLGRTDDQVKIRGFRIELGEIEAALLEHPEVREAAVLAVSDGLAGRRLVAYVAPDLLEAALREHLQARLPDYMVPSAFAGLTTLPLTPNGKVDRRALAAIEVAASPTDGYVAPGTAVEEILAGIWAELLGRPQVGIRDDFFRLGGHSLLATQMLARIRRSLGVELDVRTLFDAPTVESLAREIERDLLGVDVR